MPEIALPNSIQDIDAGWLTAALRSGGALPHGRVTHVDLAPLGVGQGFVGELARVKLTYDGAPASAPGSVVVKLPTTEPELRMFFIAAGVYLTESAFYRDVAPLATVPVARCYFNLVDEAGGLALVLEDLAPGQPGDQVGSCTRERAELVVRRLARLHAGFWANEALTGIDWLRALDHPERTGGLMAIYPFAWMAIKERSGDRLSQRLLAIGDALPRAYAGLAAELARPPLTLLHGDYRLDNMIFSPDGSDLTLVDWQSTGSGRGASDLAYFLIGSLKPADRRAWAGDLTRLYLDELHSLGVSGYGVDDCERDLRIAALVHFALYAILLSGADFEVDNPAMRLVNVILERLTAYFEDTDITDLIDL